jgi:flagellar basal-body rod protein FlgF
LNENLGPLGALHQERRISTLANNLSNSQTVGYKKDVPVFHSIFYHEQEQLRNQKMETTRTDFSQGELLRTGNDLDLALVGEGFFRIDTPLGIRYSRAGNFRLDQQGRLVTAGGFPVLGEGGEIALDGKKKITVEADGTIRIQGVEPGSTAEPAGKPALVRFKDPSLLKKEGHALFRLDEPQPELGVEGLEVQQGYLETANVNAVEEMTKMMEAFRTYETCLKVIQANDEMNGKAVNEVGRT